MNPARLRAYFYLIIVVIIWGVAPSVIKFALRELPPFLFLTYRFLITSVFLLPFYLASKEKGLRLSTFPLLILTSIFGSILNLGLLFYGTNLTTSLDSSLISATSPILVIVAGALFLHDKITKREKLGVFVALLGTFVIAIQSFFESGVNTSHSVLGNLIIFGSNVAFATYLLLSKEALRKNISPFSITFWMFFVGLITTIPLAIQESHTTNFLPLIAKVSFSAQLSVIFMALISGALAYILYQKAQKTIEASEASVFNYLPPIVTAPVATLWLHEQITTPYILGSVVIALGVILAEWKKSR